MKFQVTENRIKVTGTKEEIKVAEMCKQDHYIYSFDNMIGKPQIFRGDAVFTVGDSYPSHITHKEANLIKEVTESFKKETGSEMAWGYILETEIV